MSAHPPEGAVPAGYAELLEALKVRVRGAQVRAARAANTEVLGLYWSIGRDILDRQNTAGWGARVVDRLATDLRLEFPDQRGWSRSNLLYMRAFAAAWPDLQEVVPQAVGQLPWGHVRAQHADVAGGAARVGLSVGAFLSAAGVAVARGDGPGVDPEAAAGLASPATGGAAGGALAGGAGRGVGSVGGVGLDRRTGDALDDLETQLGRIGNLLNQAVRVANSTGQVDGRLLGAADAVRRLALRVNGVLDGVRLDRRGRAR